MTILTQTKADFVNSFLNDISNLYSFIGTQALENKKGFSNYFSIIQDADHATNQLALNILRRLIETADQKFRDEPMRKQKYHIKAKHQRTITTIFGSLTFEKTFYENKFTKKPYVYVDDFFGFEKYQRFDLFVKSLVVQACSEMSIAKAAQKISDMIGERTNLGVKEIKISRQTARTFVRKFKLNPSNFRKKETTPDTLFIMFDEKYVPLQKEGKKKAMVYHGVIFEGIRPVKGHKKRKELTGKNSFSSRNLTKLNESLLDYIYGSYDLDKIKKIHIMGDGALWIKNAAREFVMNGCDVKFTLDKFHFKKALRLVFLDDEKEDIALEKILDDNKQDDKKE